MAVPIDGAGPMETALCGKVPHDDQESAARHMAELAAHNQLTGQGRPGRALHTYPCPQCSTCLGRRVWHVGHSRRKEPRP
jgi:hypothetical protein